MINVKNISKNYGRNLGIHNVSFEVEKNEIIGLIGRNGAGKTTVLNIITGYISAEEGDVEIDSYNILKEPQKAKTKIGYLPEKAPIYTDMTVDEYIEFCADLKKIDKEHQEAHLDEICTLTGINEVRGRLCKNLSKGYVQRLGMAQALVGNPEILILDEPTIGLDPNQIIQTRNLIKKLNKSHTIIISSHMLSEIAQICDRVIILKDGKIAAVDTLQNLQKAVEKADYMQVRIKNADENFKDFLSEAKGVISIEPIGEIENNTFDFLVCFKKGTSAREDIFNITVKNKKKILMMKPKEKSIEEIFLNITQKSMEA